MEYEKKSEDFMDEAESSTVLKNDEYKEKEEISGDNINSNCNTSLNYINTRSNENDNMDDSTKKYEDEGDEFVSLQEKFLNDLSNSFEVEKGDIKCTSNDNTEVEISTTIDNELMELNELTQNISISEDISGYNDGGDDDEGGDDDDGGDGDEVHNDDGGDEKSRHFSMESDKKTIQEDDDDAHIHLKNDAKKVNYNSGDEEKENDSSKQQQKKENKEDKEDRSNRINYKGMVKENTINLSRRNLKEVDSQLLILSNLTRLNLSYNHLTHLPEVFFGCFPNLQWLDLRHNHLESLPSKGLENHECLQVMMLDDNSLSRLPCQIGCIKSLRSLGLRCNPLEHPLKDMKEKGFKAIMTFLSEEYTQAFNHSYKENNGSHENVNNNENNENNKKKKLFKSVLYKRIGSKKNTNNKNNNSKSFINQSDKYILNNYGEPVSDEVLELNFKKDLNKIKTTAEKTKQACVLEAVLQTDNLSNWQDSYKDAQGQLMRQKMANGGILEYDDPATMAPFDVSEKNLMMISNEERMENNLTNEKVFKPSNMPMHVKMRLEAAKLSHENFLKSRAHQHKNHVIRRRYDTMLPSHALQATRDDLHLALKLQEEIHKKQKELEYGMSTLPPNILN